MSAVTLSAQALITVADALTFLQDQGGGGGANDLLRDHINGVSAMILKATGRDRLIWISGDNITEFRDGFGDDDMFLHNAPLRKLVSVDLRPHYDTAVSLTVPVPPATYSDDMFFDERSGMVELKTRVFPEGRKQVKFVYEAGYYKQDTPTSGDPADPEYLELKMLALNVMARGWSRWKNQTHGVASESRGDVSISYTADDLTKSERSALHRYRRSLYA